MTSPPEGAARRNFGIGLAAAYAILSVLVLGPRLLVDETLFERDISLVWLPMADTVARIVSAGEAPLWDPYRGFGHPLAADPRAQVFYPPAWLNFVVPTWRSYSLLALFHLWLGGIGAYRLARALGGSRLAASTAGAAFLLSGPFVAIVSTWHHQAAAAWIPWVFRAFAVGSRSAIAATVAAQVFAGSPEISAGTLGFALAGAWGAAFAGIAVGARRLAAGLALGLGLSAAQWIPTLAFASEASRAAAGALWSLHPASLLEMATPVRLDRWALSDAALRELFDGAQPWLMSRYLGLSALVVAAAAAFGESGSSRRVARALLGLASVACVAAMWGRGPFAALGSLPGLPSFRYPSKFLIFTAVFVAVAAGLAIDRFDGPRVRRVAVAGLAALMAALAVGVQTAGERGIGLATATADDLPRLAVAGLALAALAFGPSAFAPRVGAPTLATLCVAADLFGRAYGLHAAAPQELFRERPDLTGIAPGSRVYVEDYSIASGGSRPGQSIYTALTGPEGWSRSAASIRAVLRYLNPPTAARWGLRGSFDSDILDFEPAGMKDVIAHFRSTTDPQRRLRWLELAGVDHAATLGAEKGAALLPLRSSRDLGLAEPMRLYAVPAPRPRDSVVRSCLQAAGRQPLDLLSDPVFDFTNEVWLDDCHEGVGLLPRRTGVSAEGEGGSFRRLEVRSGGGGWLVSLDAWDAGWTATVNGAPAPVLRADGLFRAVRIPPGAAAVVYRYRPRSLWLGAAISVVALAVLAAWRPDPPREARAPALLG